MAFQPFAKGPRQPGAPLSAMLRGAPQYLPNPQDSRRKALKKRKARRVVR